MKPIIENFIETRVEKGQYFDSHAVIAYLLQKHTDLYLQGAGANDKVEMYHGRIAQMLNEFVNPGKGVQIQCIGECVSKNIKDKFSKCTLWKRIN